MCKLGFKIITLLNQLCPLSFRDKTNGKYFFEIEKIVIYLQEITHA